MVRQLVRERRHCVRAKRILSIQFRLEKSQKRNIDKSWGLSTTQDMSLEGLSFYTDREYCIDDILSLHVIMSGILDIYKGHGKVIRMERTKSGACFLAAVKFVEKEYMGRDLKANRRSVKKSQVQRRL